MRASEHSSAPSLSNEQTWFTRTEQGRFGESPRSETLPDLGLRGGGSLRLFCFFVWGLPAALTGVLVAFAGEWTAVSFRLKGWPGSSLWGAVAFFSLHEPRSKSSRIGISLVTSPRLSLCGLELKWLIFLKPGQSELSLRT